MAVLESCPKHNMVAYLEKTDGNAEFHEIIDFLTRSSIHYALTVSPVVSTTFVEQFWTSAKSKTINNVRYINAKVTGKPVTISEASIRSDLLFNDANGIDSLNNQAIFDAIQLMGYEGDLTVLTFNKALFLPQWRFLFHTMNHCLSSKSTSWDQIPTNIATAVICLTTNQKYNFSKLIFMLKNVSVPLDHFPIHALTSKVFSFMVKKGKHFSGKVTPLFAYMLVQPTEDEGDISERQAEPQPTPSPPHTSDAHFGPQPDPSHRPSPSIPVPGPLLEGSGRNQGGQSSSDTSISGNEGGLTLQSVYDLYLSLCTQVTTQAAEIKALKAVKIKKQQKQRRSVSIQGRITVKSSSKAEPSMHKDQAIDDFDRMDYMETDAYKEEGVSTEDKVSIDKHKVSTDKHEVSTDQQSKGTDKANVSTNGQDKGTAEKKEKDLRETATQTSPTTTSAPTSAIFGDDETIAQVLITMSQNKEKLKEKEKGVELRDVEEIERHRPTLTRSVLTLKPLPKIDPKDKAKKRIEEDKSDESDTESKDITTAEKKFKQLTNDEEVVKTIQEEWEAEEERKRLAKEEATKNALIRNYDDIQARIEADRLLAVRLQEEERESSSQ
ncbi:hypothetical protein Tco_0617795 [Tanacetum coccineum]